MHIAFLTPEYPHELTKASGGMGTSIKNLANAMSRNGHQVTLFIYGQESGQVFVENNINFHLIPQRRYSLAGFYLYRKLIQNYVNAHTATVDLVEAPDWTGITAFMSLTKPLVIRFHGSDTYFCHIENRKQKWKNKWFEKRAVKKAAGFIAPTHFAGEKSMQLFNQPLNKLQVIHYGLELDQFVNQHPERFENYRLLNLGTLIRKKGVFQLIDIFNQIVELQPESTLVFIGADSGDVLTGAPSTWELMQSKMTQKAAGRISYLGKVPYEEVQDQIKKAHLCLYPSLAETLGMVTIESMALKKVVINTNIGWAQDLIEHGHDGFMHHPDDINSYVDSTMKLFVDDTMLQNIGAQARRKVEEKFDIDTLVGQNIAFYNKVLKR